MIDLTTHRTMSERSYHGATSRSRGTERERPTLVTLSRNTVNRDGLTFIWELQDKQWHEGIFVM